MGSGYELNIKLQRLRRFLKTRDREGILLSTRANFSWLTGGRTNHVRSDVEHGVASIWVTSKVIELWCNSVEEKRFQEEETKNIPFSYRVYPWYTPPFFSVKKKAISDDGTYGFPAFKDDISKLRWGLVPEEILRYREVGKLSGEALEFVGKRVRKGWRENQVAAELSKELVGRGLEATVILVGSDERLQNYRHPLPTSHKIRKIVMMVICAKGYGLIANLTRIIYFGKIPAELNRRHESCLKVECAMWNKSRPGVESREVFEAGVMEYSKQGFSGEWKKHHQGGPTGYETRDYLATPHSVHRLVENQALAWNPSITGTKSEDTLLLTKKGLEILTLTPHWPRVKVKFEGKEYWRPNILAVYK